MPAHPWERSAHILHFQMAIHMRFPWLSENSLTIGSTRLRPFRTIMPGSSLNAARVWPGRGGLHTWYPGNSLAKCQSFR